MRPSTMPLASIAGALGRGSLVMTILSREGSIAPPPEDDDASARRASQPEPAAEPALEPAPYRPGKPEEHGHDGGEDQHLGGTHAARLYPRRHAEPTVQAGRTTSSSRVQTGGRSPTTTRSSAAARAYSIAYYSRRARSTAAGGVPTRSVSSWNDTSRDAPTTLRRSASS